MSHVGELVGEHTHVNNEPLTEEQRQKIVSKLNTIYGSNPGGNQFYLGSKGDSIGIMQLGTYVNPKLALHTDYFGALDRMMKCVERNAAVTGKRQEVVCKNEYTQLRKAAFENKLLYHHINARWF